MLLLKETIIISLLFSLSDAETTEGSEPAKPREICSTGPRSDNEDNNSRHEAALKPFETEPERSEKEPRKPNSTYSKLSIPIGDQKFNKDDYVINKIKWTNSSYFEEDSLFSSNQEMTLNCNVQSDNKCSTVFREYFNSLQPRTNCDDTQSELSVIMEPSDYQPCNIQDIFSNDDEVDKSNSEQKLLLSVKRTNTHNPHPSLTTGTPGLGQLPVSCLLTCGKSPDISKTYLREGQMGCDYGRKIFEICRMI